MTTSSNSDTDVDVGKLVKADDQERLVELGAQDLGAKEGEGSAVDLDEALAISDGVSDRYFRVRKTSLEYSQPIRRNTDRSRSSSCRSTGLTALPTS